MVHALEEVRRVLTPDGALLDVRPLSGKWQVEVTSARGLKGTGHVDDFSEPLEADRASNEAMQNIEARGWFKREQEEFFSFYYSWDTPSEMEEFFADDWAEVAQLSDPVRMATRSAWASADADARVRVNVRILMARWKVIKD